jgi:succinate dehydrogenase / fumarate reductase flavoprotein subunit
MNGLAQHEVHEYDVVVIGAGGAGLRAAIESASQGMRTAIICKSLLGKAHTVMAEGGIAAALRNVWPEDSWQVHFRDTMRGGKMLNNWRMAQLHAQEAPDRVLELERWGALFDRTKDGRILQRDFGGHRYARLAHVGDRTGLEMIRTLQQHAVHLGIDVFMECTVNRLLKDGDRVAGVVAYWRQSGKFIVFKAPAVVLATGGIGKSYAITSNSWEYTGDGHAMALRAGADLIDMEFVQFHPTGMVWPRSVAGILVTEGVRGDGGTLRNSRASGSCSATSPTSSRRRRRTTRPRPIAGTRTRRTTAGRRTFCRGTRSRGRSTPRSRRAGVALAAASSSTSTRGARPTTSAGGSRRCTTSSRSSPE